MKKKITFLGHCIIIRHSDFLTNIFEAWASEHEVQDKHFFKDIYKTINSQHYQISTVEKKASKREERWSQQGVAFRN